MIVHETSPITQGFPALVVKWMRRVPMYFWVLDLWPESLQAAGNINNRHVLGFFAWVAKLMYRNSEKILISSRGFRESILDKGDFEDKLVYFPNWAEDVFAASPDVQIPALPDGFKVMFAGNVGEAQDFDNVLRAAMLLKGTGVRLIILGDGRKKAWADSFVAENGLEDVVFMMGRHPLKTMPAYFSQADVLFLSLKNDYIFSLTAPAKLQAYMASGEPVLAMVDGEARNLIDDAECGLSCAAGDYEAFAQCVLTIKSMSADERVGMGRNGKKYFDKYFRKDKCIDSLCNLLNDR